MARSALDVRKQATYALLLVHVLLDSPYVSRVTWHVVAKEHFNIRSTCDSFLKIQYTVSPIYCIFGVTNRLVGRYNFLKNPWVFSSKNLPQRSTLGTWCISSSNSTLPGPLGLLGLGVWNLQDRAIKNHVNHNRPSNANPTSKELLRDHGGSSAVKKGLISWVPGWHWLDPALKKRLIIDDSPIAVGCISSINSTPLKRNEAVPWNERKRIIWTNHEFTGDMNSLPEKVLQNAPSSNHTNG